MRDDKVNDRLLKAAIAAEEKMSVADTTEDLNKTRNYGKILIFLLVILAVFEMTAMHGILSLKDVVFKYSETTQGTVTKLEYKSEVGKHTKYRDPTKYYKPIVEYDIDGKHYIAEVRNDSKKQRDLPKVGSKIQLRYAPGEPETVYLSDGADKDSLQFWLNVASLICNTFSMIVVSLWAKHYFRPNSDGQFVSLALRLPGVVTAAIVFVLEVFVVVVGVMYM